MSIIFGDLLGIEFGLEAHEGDLFVLESGGCSLSLNADFFSSLDSVTTESLTPTAPDIWDSRTSAWELKLTNQKLPVIFGNPIIIENQNHIHIGIDIFGSVFFMLSRYEETIQPDRDNHDRFPATASLAHKAGFLNRPIVDEYIEILWAAMHRLWPGLTRQKRTAKIRVTCDVDIPFDRSSESLHSLIRACSGDILKRRNNHLAYSRIKNYSARKKGNYQYDPFYTFDWYMDACEKAGRKASFYFISDRPAGAIDCFYNIDDPEILALLHRIHARGHELGVHGSYSSYQSDKTVQFEREKMLKACKQAGLDTKIHGNRQHFLRWDSSQTPDHLEKAGFTYDTSGSYADMPGFRYGTARPFRMWSWRKRTALSIVQKPLVLMESSLIADRYMGLGYGDEALAVGQQLKHRAMMYGGDFSLLWHNSHFTTKEDKRFFRELIL